jgi:hypothetical protein
MQCAIRNDLAGVTENGKDEKEEVSPERAGPAFFVTWRQKTRSDGHCDNLIGSWI